MTLSKTLSLLRLDYRAALRFFKREPGLGSLVSFLLTPGFIAVALYRVSHYFHAKGFTGLGRAVGLLCFFLTGADIHPATEVGGGLVMLHTLASIVYGKLGEDVTLTSRVYVGPDGSRLDIGAGPGLPVLGDRVLMGGGSMVAGPRRIGDDVFIAAHSLVIDDVPSGRKVFGNPARILGGRRTNAGLIQAAVKERAGA